MGVHMLKEGGAKFQTRWEAEEADHAAYKAKQERILGRRQANYEKKIAVSANVKVQGYERLFSGGVYLQAGGWLPSTLPHPGRPSHAHASTQGTDEETTGLHPGRVED